MVPVREIRRKARSSHSTLWSLSIAWSGQDGLPWSQDSLCDQGALENIKANGKGEIDLDEIPMDDQKTYEMLQRGDTLGVFQLESSGMTALVVRMKPDCFEDLIALVALYRPGPLESGMADQYVRCKHKEEPVHFLHPALAESTKETYSHPVPGTGHADHLRWRDTLLEQTCCEKEKAEVMAEQREKFINGAVKTM